MKAFNNILKFVIVATLSTTICYTSVGQSIRTPNNQIVYTVPNWDTAPLIAEWEAQAAAWIDANSSNAQKLAAATSNFNCHSYAWHVSDGGSASNSWINYYYNDGPNLSKYWTNDAFSVTTEVDEYCKIFYGTTDDHSAIKTSTSVVRSKWGRWGLYEHSLTDCPYQDSPTYTFYSSPISGDDLICTSETYSACNISGASYTWTGDEISISGSGYSITATKTGNAEEGWIHAEISSPYSGTTFGSAKKPVWVGIPDFTSISGPNPPISYKGCTGQQYDFWASPARDPLSGSTYQWMVVGGDYYFQYQYQDWVTIVFTDPSDYYQVIGRATNTCGPTNWISTYDNYYDYIEIMDCYYFSMCPNPASDYITITLTEPATDINSGDLKKPLNYNVQIFDYNGILHYSTIKSVDNFAIPVSNLKDGSYTVCITYGKKIETLSLIIKH